MLLLCPLHASPTYPLGKWQSTIDDVEFWYQRAKVLQSSTKFSMLDFSIGELTTKREKKDQGRLQDQECPFHYI